MANNTETEIGILNSFLRTERSAVEAYRTALSAVQNDLARRGLEGVQQDHEERLGFLEERITRLGGTPASDGSASWGATSGDEHAVLSTLEQGENHELEELERELPRLHGEIRRFCRMELLPRQRRIHDQLSHLSRTIH